MLTLTVREQTTGPPELLLFLNIDILKFHDHIWNPLKKCIKMSINMPGIGSLINEIDVN